MPDDLAEWIHATTQPQKQGIYTRVISVLRKHGISIIAYVYTLCVPGGISVHYLTLERKNMASLQPNLCIINQLNNEDPRTY